MVQQNLVSYIMTQLRRGVKLEDINRFLLEAGYDKAEVESSIQYVINVQTNPKLAEEQRIQQLTSYIQTQITAGYNQQAISNFLISKGYPYYEVNSALQQATLPKKETHFEHKLVVFALIAMFVMTTAVTLMYFKAYTLIGIGVPEKLLDVEASQLTTIVQQGGDLTFQVKLINFGYEKRFDVVLKYQVMDRTTQTTVLEKSETVALSTTVENIVKFDMPADFKTGKYVLRVDATYNDFTATSGFIFDVLPAQVAKETIEKILANVTKKENVSEIPELAQNVTTPGETVPTAKPTPIAKVEEVKFYENLTRNQAFERVKAVSVMDQQKAIDMCKSFIYTGNTEQCLIMLSQFKKQGAICEEIENTLAKDRCYVELARSTGISEFCNKISKPQVKSSCKMFSTAKSIQTAGKEGKQEELFSLMLTLPS